MNLGARLDFYRERSDVSERADAFYRAQEETLDALTNPAVVDSVSAKKAGILSEIVRTAVPIGLNKRDQLMPSSQDSDAPQVFMRMDGEEGMAIDVSRFTHSLVEPGHTLRSARYLLDTLAEVTVVRNTGANKTNTTIQAAFAVLPEVLPKDLPGVFAHEAWHYHTYRSPVSVRNDGIDSFKVVDERQAYAIEGAIGTVMCPDKYWYDPELLATVLDTDSPQTPYSQLVPEEHIPVDVTPNQEGAYNFGRPILVRAMTLAYSGSESNPPTQDEITAFKANGIIGN